MRNLLLLAGLWFAVSAMAQTVVESSEIKDEEGNTLRRSIIKDDENHWRAVWELIKKGEPPELLNTWDVDGNPVGWFCFISFHLSKDAVDVFGSMFAPSMYDLFQIEKKNGQWSWTKWCPVNEEGMSVNMNPLPTARWLGPGKWEVKSNDTYKERPPVTIELLGMWNQKHPSEIAVAKKNGKAYPYGKLPEVEKGNPAKPSRQKSNRLQ